MLTHLKANLKITILYVSSLSFFVFMLLGASCASVTNIEDKVHQDILDELRANNNPIGMMGGTWYMSEQELHSVFPELYSLDINIFQRDTAYYGQAALASYVFQNGLLLQVLITFKNNDHSLGALKNNYERNQTFLSYDYGTMPQYKVSEFLSVQESQEYFLSEKKMGRVVLVHRLVILEGVLGEQIYMYLGQE